MRGIGSYGLTAGRCFKVHCSRLLVCITAAVSVPCAVTDDRQPAFAKQARADSRLLAQAFRPRCRGRLAPQFTCAAHSMDSACKAHSQRSFPALSGRRSPCHAAAIAALRASHGRARHCARQKRQWNCGACAYVVTGHSRARRFDATDLTGCRRGTQRWQRGNWRFIPRGVVW